jgi:general secretion pathway protein G
LSTLTFHFRVLLLLNPLRFSADAPTMHRAHPSCRRGFSLVEILIVVVILGILSAMVIPQFSGATTDSQAGNLRAQLGALNNSIELYKSQNRGAYPDFAGEGWGDSSDATSLIGGRYIKDIPRHPRYAQGDALATTVTTTTTANVRGSATAGWVWNRTDRELYASFFNETTGAMSSTATD